MSIFYPDYRFHRVYEISPVWLRERGISVLLLDVDNTLTTHNNPDVPEQIQNWIQKMREADIRLLILSNNKQERVKPFADQLGLGCIASAAKPLSGGVKRACERLGVNKRQIAIVGDQIFTDILCGKWSGIKSILVEPIELEQMAFFKLKRKLEKIVLKQEDKGRKNG